jgi:hypothetical protein
MESDDNQNNIKDVPVTTQWVPEVETETQILFSSLYPNHYGNWAVSLAQNLLQRLSVSSDLASL